MQVFHFLPEQWALAALKTQRIKVSRFNDLNDPFELMAMSLEDKVSRRLMRELKERLNNRLRLLSCSLDWSSPLLWGHYAEKHKGIALVLDVPNDLATEVTYTKDRAAIDHRKLREAPASEAQRELLKMFTTKYSQWSYENEVRLQFLASDIFEVDGLDFIEFDNEIKVKGIVLGPLNKTSSEKIKESLPRGMTIEVITTRIAFKSFDVVHQNQRPPFLVTGAG